MQTDFDAIIVGAGPAGSTAAILLAQAGWSIALVEKQAFPRRKVCGECIAASNLPLLHALGVGAAFEAGAGAELRRVALLRGARKVVAELPPAADPRWRYGRALGRETLDTLLLERARSAGAVVLQPWSVQEIGGVPGAHRCEIRSHEPGLVTGAQRGEVRSAEPALERSPMHALRSSDRARELRSDDIERDADVEPATRSATLQAPIVIAAHGSWEPLPSQRDARRRRRGAADLFAFKANFGGAALAEGLLPVLSFDGGYGGMVVAERGITTLACCIRADRLDACRRAAPGMRAGEVVEALLVRECAGVAEVLRHARRDGPWLASGPLEPGVRLRRDDALFRIGNAAGEVHPIIGEGISM
ncbi:MAG: FAD-dependent monooxygenase, partial [Caldimonas sp.]